MTSDAVVKETILARISLAGHTRKHEHPERRPIKSAKEEKPVKKESGQLGTCQNGKGSRMSGKLFFIHGTDTRDTEDIVALIRDRVHRIGRYEATDVIPVEWGKAVGPNDQLDIESVLPRATTRRAGTEVPTDSDDRWLLLSANPFSELQVLQYWPGVRAAINMPNEVLPSTVLANRLRALPGEAADRSSGNVFSSAEWQAAGQAVGASELFAQAVDRRGPDDELVLQAVSDTIVALLVHGRTAELLSKRRGIPDPEGLDTLAAGILEDLATSRGAAGEWILRKVVLPSAVRYARKNRQSIMTGVASFARDITFYLQHGDAIREYIADQLHAHAPEGQAVVMAHSLGGIAALDVLSENEATARLIDLLVTVGSQSSLLYQMDSLHSLRRGSSLNTPFSRWLNIYDPADFLSFCVDNVFKSQEGPRDKSVNNGLEFPESHSGYFVNDQVYDATRDRLRQ